MPPLPIFDHENKDFLTSAQSRCGVRQLLSTVSWDLRAELGIPDVVHCISGAPGATRKASWAPLKGVMSAKKPLKVLRPRQGRSRRKYVFTNGWSLICPPGNGFFLPVCCPSNIWFVSPSLNIFRLFRSNFRDFKSKYYFAVQILEKSPRRVNDKCKFQGLIPAFSQASRLSCLSNPGKAKIKQHFT